MKNKIEFVNDIWETGGSHVITIKSKKRKEMNLKAGESVKITIERVFK